MNIRSLGHLGLTLALPAIGCAERRIASYVARHGCSPDQIEIVKTADGIHRVSGCKLAGELACWAPTWTTVSCRPSQADREAYARRCAQLTLAGQTLPPPSSADLDRTCTKDCVRSARELVHTLQEQVNLPAHTCLQCAIDASSMHRGEVFGQIDVTFRIDGDGTVTHGSAHSGTITGELPFCVLGAFSRARFGPTKGRREAFVVRAPIVFRPGEPSPMRPFPAPGLRRNP